MFNTSTRKEDLSLKLRSHNLKNAKDQTRALEVESRKMEDRLQELKMAMTHEKELRQATNGPGAGFWSSGQEGNLGNYATEVLNKPKKSSSASSTKSSASSNREKSSKKKKVKVLKDEPITVPERKKAPGTMANIAQRNLIQNKEKIKGPRCGQCEQKGANVSCQECGEDYCAGCFAAFHLRGALKKHRSVPVGSKGMSRPNMTPRSAPVNDTHSARSMNEPRHDNTYNNNNNYMANGRESPAGYSNDNNQNSLLDGEFDEQANASEFASALAEWRMGKGGSKNNNKPAASPQPQKQPRTIKPRPPMASNTTSTENGTSTQEEKVPPIEIKFKSSLTYAERLLLKKHRRTELGMSNITPRQGTGFAIKSAVFDREPTEFEEEHVLFDEVYGLVTPRGGAMDPFSESAHIKQEADNFYHTTHEELANMEREERSESSLSIVMVDNVPAHRLRRYEQSSNYDVTEGPDDTVYHIDSSRVTPEGAHARYAFATPPASGRPSPSGRRSTSARRSYTISPISAAVKHGKENLPGVDNVDMTVISTNVLLRKGTGDTSARGTPPSSARAKNTPRTKSAVKDRPVSRTKDRPVSARAKSRAESRTGSRAEGRPGSRAKSRTYMYGEGNLTKGPSESLKEIARLAGQVPAPEYEKSDLSSFFTVGVKPVTPRDRVMTPSGQRKKEKKDEAGIEKWRVSNKLYTMGPRSWRPDSSLGDNADETQVASYLQDPGVAALEKMTNDVVNDMLTPRDQDVGVTTERPDSTLSWSWSQQFDDPKPKDSLKPKKPKDRLPVGSEEPSRSNTQYSMLDQRQSTSTSIRPMSRTSRERSILMKEKRDKAFQQGEDMFAASPPPTLSNLRAPSATGGSRPSTPRTPRPNSRGVSRPDSGRPGSRTPLQRGNSSLYTDPIMAESNEGRMTPSRPMSSSGRESRAIVIDGDDLTQFDELQLLQNQDDEDAIGQLEWELASQSGRITGDGQISRMSLIDPDAEIDIPEDTSPGRGLDSPINDPETELLDRQMRESVLMDDFSEMEEQMMADEDDVRALH